MHFWYRKTDWDNSYPIHTWKPALLRPRATFLHFPTASSQITRKRPRSTRSRSTTASSGPRNWAVRSGAPDLLSYRWTALRGWTVHKLALRRRGNCLFVLKQCKIGVWRSQKVRLDTCYEVRNPLRGCLVIASMLRVLAHPGFVWGVDFRERQ